MIFLLSLMSPFLKCPTIGVRTLHDLKSNFPFKFHPLHHLINFSHNSMQVAGIVFCTRKPLGFALLFMNQNYTSWVSSRSFLNCSFFLLFKFSMCSLNSASLSLLLKASAIPQRWSFRKLFLVSFQPTSAFRTWREQNIITYLKMIVLLLLLLLLLISKQLTK